MSSPGPYEYQLLHNFEMPLLRWSTTTTTSSNMINQEHSRRCSDSSSSSASFLQVSPLDYTGPLPLTSAVVSDAAQGLSFLDNSALTKSENYAAGTKSGSASTSWSRKDVLMEEDVYSAPSTPKNDCVSVASQTTELPSFPSNKADKEPQSQKCHHRIHMKNKDQPEGSNEAKVLNELKAYNVAMKAGKAMQEFEFVYKRWNLRPRKPVVKKPVCGNSGCFNNGGGSSQDTKARSQRTMGGSNKGNDETKKKMHMPKFNVALSLQEIEEDLYALTGKKPTKKPKKGSKAMQKLLDMCFPGLYLGSLTIESYKPVPDPKV